MSRKAWAENPMRRPWALRTWLSGWTLASGAAFALTFACAGLLFDLAWVGGRVPSALETALLLGIITMSGVMLFATFFMGAFFKTEILQPLTRILGSLSSVRRGRFDPAMGLGRVAEWQNLVDELKAVGEAMASSTAALEAENARRQRAVETLVSALEDTSILFRDLRQATRDLADLKTVDKLRRGFVNAVSHELRTPLTIILGFTEFLEDEVGGPLSDHQRGFVLQIQRSTRRLEFLVNDLLDFAAIEAGTFHLRREIVDLSIQIREVVEGFSALAAERSVALELDIPDATEPASADPRRIGQVMANLVHNALKFTPPGGNIRVALRDNGEALECSVRDSGVGIAPADIPKLFRSFSQLEAGRTETGTGLGLVICKSIIEAHGGTIGVDSAVGAGSTFWFRLPRPGTDPGHLQDSTEFDLAGHRKHVTA